MNKDKVKILSNSLENKLNPKDCNDPEVSALLKAGDKLKDSALNNLAPDADFKQRLKFEILAKRHANNFYMKDKISEAWNNFKFSLTRRRMVPVLGAIVLIALVTVTFKFWPNGGFSPLSIEAVYARDNFTVEPTVGGDLGVDSSTQFIIKSKTAIKDLDSLKSNIKLSPDTDFDLKAVSEYEFRLTPNNRLANKQVYRLEIASAYVNENNLTVDHNYSWAFQVKDTFKIIGSIPADKTLAPANTGIEITFSTENFSGAEKAFSISPAVDGKFEKHNRTIVFVPNKPLKINTLYTVNLAPTIINTASNENLASSYHFQFQVYDSNSKEVAIRFAQEMAEFSTNQNPAFSVYADSNSRNQQVSTKVYNYRGPEDFAGAVKKYNEIPSWAYNARQNAEVDYSNLVLAATYDLPVVDNFLALPNSLPTGYYLVEANLNGKSSFIFVQVSDVSAYTTVTDNKILFWVNTLGLTKTTEATVTNLETKTVYKTDTSGVATVDTTSSSTEAKLYKVESAGKSLVVSLPAIFDYRNNSNNFYNNHNDFYWSYLYTDRTLYQTTDEVNFWGFVKPRAGNTDIANQEITISVVEDLVFDLYNEPTVVIQQKVKTDGQGFYIGKLKLNNLKPTSFRIKAQMEGQNIYAGSYFRVENYIKPAYKINIIPSAKAIFSGDKIKYQVQANFFEGTALANKDLVVERQIESKPFFTKTNITTDSVGVVNLEYSPTCPCKGGVL